MEGFKFSGSDERPVVGGPESLNNHLICTMCAHFYLQSIVISFISEASHPYGLAIFARGSASFKWLVEVMFLWLFIYVFLENLLCTGI